MTLEGLNLTEKKLMKDSVFFDTNILVYSYSDTEKEKQAVARNLITEYNSYISTQVLQELTNILTKKFAKTWEEAVHTIVECCKNNILHTNEQGTIIIACNIADKYKFSLYDSLIIAAALQCKCKILYSEDLHHNQLIEKSLKIINPFRRM